MRQLMITLSLLLLGLSVGADAHAQRGRRGVDRAPKAGAPAPDFDLHRLGKKGKPSKKKVRLSDFKGKKAVALVFGSYT